MRKVWYLLVLLPGLVTAQEKSADELARELANPNTPMATLNFNLQYRTFDGDLPGADDQNSTMVLFQPAFPFSLSNGDMVFFRPAIPILVDQPAFSTGAAGLFGGNSVLGFDDQAFVAGAPGFDSESGIGDITFDLAYGRTTSSGLLWAAGIVSTIPTATRDELGNDRFTLGPEFMIGKLTPKYVIGAFPNHQWDVGGPGDKDISLTTMQLFGIYLPGGGWNLGTSPIISYDHESDELTLPINFTFGKTVIIGKTPWKIGAEINYYVEQPDAFGPEWMIGIKISPVVKNILQTWFL